MISTTWAQEGVLRPAEQVWGQTQSPVSTRPGAPKLSHSVLYFCVTVGKGGEGT